jgi:hypothetical protein
VISFHAAALVACSFLQVASRDKEEGMSQIDFEKLLAESLAAHGRSPRTQESYTLMLRLFGRYLERAYTGKSIDTACPEDVAAYQRHLVTERKVGFSSFNQATCALRFFYRTCLGSGVPGRLCLPESQRVIPRRGRRPTYSTPEAWRGVRGEFVGARLRKISRAPAVGRPGPSLGV